MIKKLILLAALCSPLFGQVTIYPSPTTVEQGTTVTFTCDAPTPCTFTRTGVGSITTDGDYTAPMTGGTAVVTATAGSAHANSNVTISSPPPAVSGDCATVPYPHSGVAYNKCLVVGHQEVNNGTFGGAGVNRVFWVVVPTNFVPCTANPNNCSGLVVTVGETGHGFVNSSTHGWMNLTQALNEVGGHVPYVLSMPSPAPIIVGVEDYTTSGCVGGPFIFHTWGDRNCGFATWDNGVIPDDVDLVRQVALIIQRDMHTDPKQNFLVDDWFHGGQLIAQEAFLNSDIFASFAAYADYTFYGVSSSDGTALGTLTVNQGIDAGTILPAPTSIKAPISGIIMAMSGTGLNNLTEYAECGNNTTGQLNHILTHDDILAWWKAADHLTNFIWDGSPTAKTFCLPHKYAASGLGTPNSTQSVVATGGKAGSEIDIYVMVNGLRGPPYCSWDAQGNDTYCTPLPGGIGPPVDLSIPTNTPHNNFIPAKLCDVVGKCDEKSMQYNFLLAHPKVSGTSSGGGSPSVTFTPTSAAFGSVQVGLTKSLTVTVKNTGTANLTITAVTLSGANAADFTQTSGCVSASPIVPNGTCTVPMTFTPSATGARNATITLTDNASNESFALTGTGTNTIPNPPTALTVTVH